jgi:hypothetical protein
MSTQWNNSSIKRKDVLRHFTTWVELENIMLSERSQTHTHTHKLHDSTYRKCPEQANLYGQKISGCLGLGWLGRNGSDS